MWNHYFDNKCTIYGVDINPKCLEVPKILEASNITVTIGHQESREFWRDFLKDKPKFDIVIDDGGHRMEQQIITYQEIYDHILDDGVYLCEDLHTSYWKGWGNECNPTFIEYSKNFIDMINSHHFQEDNKNFHNIDYENFRKTTNSIHYYDSVLVLEKSVNPPPTESVR
jgi:hemerythrin-like domain-containing protein